MNVVGKVPLGDPTLSCLRQENEGLDVLRTDGTEVPPISREDRGDRAPLSDRDNAGVRTAEREVGVLLDQLRHALEILGDEIGDHQITAGEGSEEGRFGRRTEIVPTDHVADFGHDRRRNQEWPGQRLQQPRALLVPDVGVVEAGDQRTGVDEDLTQLDGPSRCGRRP